MATITFNGESYTVDHAVKGADYVHGYDADGVMVCCITGVVNFDAIGFDGTYMSPSACLEETCNELAYTGGWTKNKNGATIPSNPAMHHIIASDATAYTIGVTCASRFHACENTGALVVTIPTHDVAPLPTCTEIEFVRLRDGSVTFAPASGVTLVSVDSARSISHRYGCAVLKKLNSNYWLLAGALS